MATDNGRASQRPRPWLLVLLGLVVVVYLATRMFSGPSATPTVSTGGQRAPAQAADQIDPALLDVKIETLGDEPGGPAEVSRNPFRFQPRPPPPPPPMAAAPPQTSYVPPPPAAPIGPPPIGTLIKFIGIIDTGKEKIGAFSDCKYTFSGREGEIVEGRFRVVRIGIESAVLEYVDGTGRATLPLNGQACVGK
jgi:hypothetical protein